MFIDRVVNSLISYIVGLEIFANNGILERGLKYIQGFFRRAPRVDLLKNVPLNVECLKFLKNFRE